MNSGLTSDNKEQAPGLSGMTTESERWRPADDVIADGTSAKRKTEAHHDAEDADDDGDIQASNRHLETLLQLETQARRTMEENFRRVKGFSFSFVLLASVAST